MGAKDDVATLIPTSPRALSVINEDFDNEEYFEPDETCEQNTEISNQSLASNCEQKQRKRKTAIIGPSESDLTQLKETATKLKLNTRRASYLVWRAQYMESPKFPQMCESNESNKIESGKLTGDRHKGINDSLNWIRTQLTDMRRMDQNLARQFLDIRRELTRQKLQKSCEAHEDMLDDATLGMEEFQELSKVLDEPNSSYTPSLLKNLGVTKMNLTCRRFSTC